MTTVNVDQLELPEVGAVSDDANHELMELAARIVPEGRWLVRNPLWYSVVEFNAVKELQKDRRLHTLGALLYELQGVTSGPAYESKRRAIMSRNGADHIRLRRVVSKAFTPAMVDRLRPLMAAHADRAARRMARAGQCEFVSEFANEYPVAVISAMVGVPEGDWPAISRWAHDIFLQFNMNAVEDLPTIDAAIVAMEDYVSDLIERRRVHPEDDLVTTLVELVEEGHRLSAQEMTDLVNSVILAGTDTTRNQLGLAMLTFARHQDQWAQLRADPDVIATATDEILRFEPTAAITPRVVAEDLDYRGVRFPAGTVVMLITAAANRDPGVVTCPHVFDVAVNRQPFSPLTFGSGPHYCLGAALARAELEEALRAFATRWRSFTVLEEPPMRPTTGLFGPVHLHLAIEAEEH